MRETVQIVVYADGSWEVWRDFGPQRRFPYARGRAHTQAAGIKKARRAARSAAFSGGPYVETVDARQVTT